MARGSSLTLRRPAAQYHVAGEAKQTAAAVTATLGGGPVPLQLEINFFVNGVARARITDPAKPRWEVCSRARSPSRPRPCARTPATTPGDARRLGVTRGGCCADAVAGVQAPETIEKLDAAAYRVLAAGDSVMPAALAGKEAGSLVLAYGGTANAEPNVVTVQVGRACGAGRGGARPRRGVGGHRAPRARGCG